MVVWNWMPGSARGPGGVGRSSPTGRAPSAVLTVRPVEPRGRAPSPCRAIDRVQELVGDAHRVVGVLAGDGEIGLAVPVGVVVGEVDVLVALARELDDAADVVVGHQVAPRLLDGALAGPGSWSGSKQASSLGLAVDAGLHDGLEPALADLGAGDERGDLLLLLHLPVDVVLDVGMVDVDHDHLGGAPRGAARLDGAGRAVADLEEAHQARRLAAARQLLVLAAELGEVGAGAGAVLEEARLAHPQVHDAALVDEIVLDRLDEAGVRLRDARRPTASGVSSPVSGST